MRDRIGVSPLVVDRPIARRPMSSRYETRRSLVKIQSPLPINQRVAGNRSFFSIVRSGEVGGAEEGSRGEFQSGTPEVIPDK